MLTMPNSPRIIGRACGNTYPALLGDVPLFGMPQDWKFATADASPYFNCAHETPSAKVPALNPEVPTCRNLKSMLQGWG